MDSKDSLRQMGRSMDQAQGMIRSLSEPDDASRRFHISFSSERPVRRSFGNEILSHDDGAADLSRLNNSGPVLFNHDRNRVIGHVERAWIENGRGEADIILDADEFSCTVADKIRSGSLRSTSVWYDPGGADAWEDVGQGQRSRDGKFSGPCSILRKWTPVELSIVTVPADPSVGVGRDAEILEQHTASEQEEQIMSKEEEKNKGTTQEPQEAEKKEPEKTPETKETPPEPEKKPDDEKGSGRSFFDEGTSRALEIVGMCRNFDMDPDQYLRSGMSIESVRKSIMDELCARKTPVPGSGVHITDEADHKREQIRDSILVRGGIIDLRDAVPGTSRYMHRHTRDLFREAYMSEGLSRSRVDDMEDTELFGRYMSQQAESYGRAHENSTALFPGIVDDAMEKAIAAGYEHLPVTYDRISTKISVKDFKEHRHLYTYGGTTRRFEKLPEGGEIKADNIQMAQLPSVHTETFAKQWSMTRELMINDDIGLVAEIPRQYGEAYRQTINDMVFDVYLKNQNCADGTPLFSGEKGHKNLMGTGTTVEAEAFSDMLRILQSQTDQFGDRIPFKPHILLVPAAMENDAYTLFHSMSIQTTDNTQAASPYYNYGVTVVVDATIDARCGEDATPWFLFAQGTFPVELAYLNGNEGLNRRAMQVPGQLGIIFDFWGDVGVNVTDYRQVVKNPGLAVPMKYGLAK